MATDETSPRLEVPAPTSGVRVWALVFAAAAAAGVIAWLADEPFHQMFKPPLRRVVTMGYESLRATPHETRAAHIKNATLAYGLSALFLGLGLGVAGGIVRGDVRSGLIAGLKGALFGVLLTCALSIPSQLGYWRYFGDNAENEELFVPLLFHVVSWSGIGLGGGLALAMGLNSDREVLLRALVGGVFGVILGTVIFEFVGAAVFPLDKTTFPLSASTGSRLLARLLIAVGAAAFSLKMLSAHRSKSEVVVTTPTEA